MKRNSVVFLLISMFIIKVNNLTAQAQVDVVPVDTVQLDLAQVDIASDSVELRKIKISASKVLQGLATACICIANVVGAKTKKEKQESTYTAISSAFQLAANVCDDHKKHKQKKQAKKLQVNSAEEPNAETHEQDNSKTTKDAETAKDSGTKSINFGYLQQIQDLSTEQEKMDLINKILQNKQTTETLLDEVNFATKLLLIDALFE